MKIVFLDHAIVDPGDLSWETLQSLGTLHHYERSTREEALIRARDADVLIVDSFGVDRDFMTQCPNLKLIVIAATGFNHIDIHAAEELGIGVANVPSYAADTVAQHAFALLLTLTNSIGIYDRAVKDGEWQRAKDYTFIKAPIFLLAGKSIGIVGYGSIGRRIAAIAEGFGMTVNIYSRDPEAAIRSDVVSLSCPLTEDNRHMVNDAFISRMKDGAYLINTARGGLIDEDALARALRSGKLAGAGLDVMGSEPPAESPLLDIPNCCITPHIAFIAKEARQTIMDVIADNIRSWAEGGRLNRLDRGNIR
ncbi:MAG: D-2-hydroxyacid dehydrogenase [Bacillota bacterium]|nr:D-2-hydroxyacid dehydrogenase [Bacillota bacterium]